VNVARLCLYLVALFLIAFADITNLQMSVIFYLYLGSLYIEAKDNNIRSLIFLLVFIQVIFDQADWVFYTIGRYYWETGIVAGDAILNGLILINFLVLIHCIYYRCEIMNWATKRFGLRHFEYRPIKADVIQINVIRIISLYTILYIITTILEIYAMNRIPLNNAYSTTYNELLEIYKTNGLVFVEMNRKLEVLRHATMILLLHTYLKKIDNTRILKA
jgi:hypothetical protein